MRPQIRINGKTALQIRFQEQVDAMTQMYGQGMSICQIAKAINRNHSTVFKTLVRHGVEMRHRPRRECVVSKPEMARLYTEGLSITKIAEHFNITKPTVSKYLRLQGVERRKPIYPPKAPPKPRKREVETPYNVEQMMKRVDMIVRLRIRRAA